MNTYTVTLVIEAETPEDAHDTLLWVIDQGGSNVDSLF